MLTILGINAYHGDSAAAIVRDGVLVAAVEEERFRRIKHWAGLPTQAMRYCVEEAAGIRFADLDHIAINLNPKVNNLRRAGYALTRRPDFRLILSRLKKISKTATVEKAVHEAFPDQAIKARLHYVEHHLAHLASGFLVSPFDEAVNVSIDGFGDFASAAWGMGRGAEIQIDGRVYFPHSLGMFYSAITQWLGFPHYGDEYKVMGLAPYGKPEFLKEMREIVRVKTDGTFELNLRFFRHHVENVPYRWDNGSPEVGDLFAPALEELLGTRRQKDEPLSQRHKDIARSAQAMYEEAAFALLNTLHARYQCPNLTLSGGCAMNSVANGKVYLQTPFRKMYLPAAAGDAGGAIGAAFVIHHQQDKDKKPAAASGPPAHFFMDHAYVGPEFDRDAISQLLDRRKKEIEAAGCRVEEIPDTDELCRRTAQCISEGQVVGWYQGRMEWGPRALGNRSIVCDPRRADMKDILNQKIKRRESFRPFAPSILREAVSEYFEQEDDVPFMMEVFQIREEKRALLPAVTHVDGSGRLQTVHRETNPRYYRLIESFAQLTGIPIVLNTSFNENEPVVCRPEEALDCFLRTKMDLLALGDFLITRHAAHP